MIVFAPDEGEEPGSIEAEQSVYDQYVLEQLKSPEYQRILIGLKRMSRALVLIRYRWQATSRPQTLAELDNLLDRQHELEKHAESIENLFVREYVFGCLDEAALTRRSLSEEVRWDIQTGLADSVVSADEWPHT